MIIWVSFMQTLRANLQSTKENTRATKFVLLLNRPAGFKKYFKKLCEKNLLLVSRNPYILWVLYGIKSLNFCPDTLMN